MGFIFGQDKISVSSFAIASFPVHKGTRVRIAVSLRSAN